MPQSRGSGQLLAWLRLLLLKSFRIKPRNENSVSWWRAGPLHRLSCGRLTTWNHRSGLQIIPRGSPPTLLRPLLWPLTWSVWLTRREETWCRGTLPERFQNTPCCLLLRGLQGIVKNLLQLFSMWHCVTASGISLLITEKSPPAPRLSHMICILLCIFFTTQAWCHHFCISQSYLVTKYFG